MNNPRHKSESAKYWEEHLLSWEASAYYKEGQQNANWWDRLSTIFRGDAMYVRMSAALDLAAPHINGMSVLDVGCASGRFPFHMLQAGAGKVYGTDISAEAIQIAQKRGAELGLQDKLEFSVMDVVQPNSALPRVDLVTALGVIEYFDAKAMSAFLGNLRTKYILLDFPDLSRRREFPTWILRQVYIRVNRLPGVYLYSLDEFAKIAEPFGFKDLRLVKRDKFYYVTNLPE
jgi:cyclopropane fatty-acyl-phospholipid synthase-like methyltransferase